MVVTFASSLADRDMFMRLRGGGIGHIYMRQIEWWLDATGWGRAWPSLGGRDPSPDLPSEDNDSPAHRSHNREDDVGDEDEDGDENENENENEGDVDDEDGEDQEHPEESDDNSDVEEGGGGGRHRPSQSIDVEQEESEEEESSLYL
jgi:hypothetical protein